MRFKNASQRKAVMAKIRGKNVYFSSNRKIIHTDSLSSAGEAKRFVRGLGSRIVIEGKPYKLKHTLKSTEGY